MVLLVLVRGVYKPLKLEHFGPGLVSGDLEWQRNIGPQMAEGVTLNGSTAAPPFQVPAPPFTQLLTNQNYMTVMPLVPFACSLFINDHVQVSKSYKSQQKELFRFSYLQMRRFCFNFFSAAISLKTERCTESSQPWVLVFPPAAGWEEKPQKLGNKCQRREEWEQYNRGSPLDIIQSNLFVSDSSGPSAMITSLGWGRLLA